MTEGNIEAGEKELDPPAPKKRKTPFETARERNEAAFVRSLPETGAYYVDDTLPPIICDSDSDADGYDIIQDMRAMGYFDDDRYDDDRWW